MAAGDSAKADQIAFHIYTKLFHVLYAARTTDTPPPNPRTDKWFNLETPLAPPASTPTAELDAFRALSSAPPAPGTPFAVQVVLAVPPPAGGTALVHAASRTRVEPEPRWVLLEEWVLHFAPAAASSPAASTSTSSTSSSSTSSSAADDADVLPPTIYKNAIPLFRALYALLRILPAWRVVRKLAVRRALGRLRVVVRLRPAAEAAGRGGGERGFGMGGNGNGGNGETTLGFGESPAAGAGAPPLPTSTHVFPGVPHPAGEFCRYRLPSSKAHVSRRSAHVSHAYIHPSSALRVLSHFRFLPLPLPLSGLFLLLSPPALLLLVRLPPFPAPRSQALPYPIHAPAIDHYSVSTLTLSATYLTTPAFTLESLEALLSSRFAVLDAGSSSRPRDGGHTPPGSAPRPRASPASRLRDLPDEDDDGDGGGDGAFVPTLARRSPGAYQHARQRADSQYSTGGAGTSIGGGMGGAGLGTPPSYRMGVHVAPYARRAASAHSPHAADVVDRFVLPRSGDPSPASGAGSFAGRERAVSQRDAGAGMGMGMGMGMVGRERERDADSGSSALFRGVASEREREREREKGVPIGGPSSLGGGGGGASGSGSGPSAIAINPFKSNTLSRSSLLRGVAGSPGHATSPIAGAGAGTGAVAFPLPPSDGAGGGSGVGSVGGIPMRKRYSSSFPHRYAAGSSVGSGGSGESGSAGAGGSGSASLAARERTASGAGAGSRSGSFLKSAPAVDEQRDEISSFVKDIDAARPLLGRYRLEQQQQQQQRGGAPDEDRDADPPSSSSSSPGTSRSGTVRGSSSTVAPAARAPSGAMLTSESEVDERLRRMNEEFMRSLVGLGGASPVSARGDGQGSQEVIGRLEFDFDGHGRG
ncbi:autophagy-related protein 13-domain-containing protein [Mycena sp. CBHHK59/15]|nr:autophagy-related protein 13-domain-containing protein [Mycena sp. CBHHK59/15]